MQKIYSSKNWKGRVHTSHGLINFIDTKAKCRHLKKFTPKGTVRQVFTRVFRLETMLDLCSFSGVYQPWLIKGLGDWRVFNWILFGQAKLCPNSYTKLDYSLTKSKQIRNYKIKMLTILAVDGIGHLQTWARYTKKKLTKR